MLVIINIVLALSCLSALIGVSLLIWQKPSRGKTLLIMGLSVALIQSLGYVIEINAKTLGEAISGVKIEYLGSVYVCYFAFFFICELCDVKLPQIIKQGYFFFETVIYFVVFTNEYHELYYRNICFIQGNMYNHISFDRGPVYYIYIASVFIGIASLSVIGFTSYRRMGKKRKQQLRSIVIAMQIPTVAMIVYLLGLTKGYDIMPLAVILSFTICTINVLRYNLFGLQEEAKEVIVDTLADGLIIVDKNYYYITANQSAKNLFPTLKEKGRLEEFTEEEALVSELFMQESEKELILNDRRFRSRVIELKDNWKKNGYLLILQDNTDSYNYITKLEELRFSAEDASRAKSAFLANMSHEIRTPMNAILGMNDIMIHNGLSGDNLSYAKDIESSGRALLSIINDILDFAKIESGKMEIIDEQYEMKRVLRDVVSMFKVRTMSTNLEFITNIDESIPSRMLGDEVRIRQVLGNILGNAVKFTKKGSVTLDVTWQKSDEDDKKALIIVAVKDTGIGIRTEDLEKIFLSFQQVDTRKNHAVEGTGLGLAITRDLLQMMGGDITIQSTYGQGSTFRMYFEQGIVNEEPMGKLEYEEETVQELGPEFTVKNARVLLVDDNKVNLRVASGLLKPYGFEIDTVESGKECLEIIREKSYDVVYMDHMMPELDGVDTLKLMREENPEKNRDVPVVALTANAVHGMEEFFKEAGFQGYLSKPIVRSELIENLRKLLPAEKIIEAKERKEQKFEAFRMGCKERFEKVIAFLKDGEDAKAQKALMGMQKQAEQMGCRELSDKFKNLSRKGLDEPLVNETQDLINKL